MIDDLIDAEWLKSFFVAPNDLRWTALLDGSALPVLAEGVRSWLEMLSDDASVAPVILPMVRGSDVIGWYATTRGFDGAYELGCGNQRLVWSGLSERLRKRSIRALPTRLRRPCVRGRVASSITSRVPIRRAIALLASASLNLAALLKRRPITKRRSVRPVGSIRADFESALLAQDAAEAETRIAELRETGRLNEENLRYLDVRLKAGLGFWPQIARDHWLIQTLSDLVLPPQTLADLLEALYRTYVDAVEADGDATATLKAFEQHVARRYPRLFASRRGIRATRIVKSFVLFEQLQNPPNPQIIAALLELLPEGDRALVLAQPPPATATPFATSAISDAQADEAFDDSQYDRAFEFYLVLPLSRKSISRLVSCVLLIGTDEARGRLLAAIDRSGGASVAGLTPAIRQKLEELRARGANVTEVPGSASTLPEWMAWAEQLHRNEDLAGAEKAVQQAATNWDVLPFAKDENLCKAFADIIGNLNETAGAIVTAIGSADFCELLSARCPTGPRDKTHSRGTLCPDCNGRSVVANRPRYSCSTAGSASDHGPLERRLCVTGQ